MSEKNEKNDIKENSIKELERKWIGQAVKYQDKRYKVTDIGCNGKLILNENDEMPTMAVDPQDVIILEKIRAEITKKIIDSEDHEFRTGEDIGFKLNRHNKQYNCNGIIKDITEDGFKITNVVIDSMHVSDELTIDFNEVENGVLNLVSDSWY